MPNFLLVYRSLPYKPEDISPENMQQAMEAWNAWIGEGFAKGWMIDPGDALMPDGKLVKAKQAVSDGPFAEAKEIVGGYAVIKADDYAGAVACVKNCPALSDPGGSVEVRQMAGLAPPKE
jgi:hypothetical protein